MRHVAYDLLPLGFRATLPAGIPVASTLELDPA